MLERLDPDGVQRRDERALEREERSAHLGRYLSLADDGIGGVRLKGRGTVEDAAAIKKVLMSLAAPVTGDPGACGGRPTDRTGACGITDRAHDGKDPREHGTRIWDALVDACRQLSATELLSESHGRRPHATVAIDHRDLVDTVGAHGVLDTGERLSSTSGARPAWSLTRCGWRWWLATGTALSRAALSPPIACDAHHIVHWAAGGVTALHNLVLLCRHHHTLIHNTPWEVRINSHDQRPEFLPPARLDPERRPIRRRVLRT